jgi:hypothetical protein
MKRLILLAILLVLSQQIVPPHVGEAIARNPSKMKLNLDLPPEQRWKEIGKVNQDLNILYLLNSLQNYYHRPIQCR